MPKLTDHEYRYLIDKAVEEEREACARLVEEGQETYSNQDDGTSHLTPRRPGNIAGLAYAAAIRARSNPV